MSESVSDKHSQWSDSGPIIKRPRYALSECLKSCCSVKDIDINLIVNSISSNAFLMVTIEKWAKAHFLKHVRISFRTASHDDRARTVSNLKFIWVTIYAYSIFKIISCPGKMLSQQQSRANIRVNTLTHNTKNALTGNYTLIIAPLLKFFTTFNIKRESNNSKAWSVKFYLARVEWHAGGHAA